MKRLFLAVLLIACLASAAHADLRFGGINVQGDTVYLMSRQDFGFGVGWTVATFHEFLELRAESVFPIVGEGSSSALLGAGIGLNIPKLIGILGGTWALPNITSSFGILGLVDFNADSGDRIEPALYLTVLKLTL